MTGGCHICGYPEMGTYRGQVILVAPDFLRHKWPDGIGIDVCLALEIQDLWRKGIHTSGHCCGHGRAPAYISVWPESVSAMIALGYETLRHPDVPDRRDHFVPKTRLDPDPPEIVELRLCEQDHIILRPNMLYRFSVDENCAECRRLRDAGSVRGVTNEL